MITHKLSTLLIAKFQLFIQSAKKGSYERSLQIIFGFQEIFINNSNFILRNIRQKRKTYSLSLMSQYISDNSQRFYQPSYEYPINQSNYFVLQSQRNNSIREGSLNRNNSVSSSLILKPGAIQQKVAGKIRRQNSMQNSINLKENDPFAKNSLLTTHISKAIFAPKDQNDYGAEQHAKSSYCNPLPVKREKMSKDFSRQKIPNHHQTRQTLTQSLKSSSNSKNSFYQQQYQLLNEKFNKIESQIKQNVNSITEHKSKIQKLEEIYQIDIHKQQKNKKHSRSISNTNSGSPTFKELSDIMSLIQETKNYQIRNSQEYRKMIEEFRSTILQFRQELNKTAKKNDIDTEIYKIKLALNNQTPTGLSRKSSYECSVAHTLHSKPKQSDSIQKIERQIHLMRISIEKLQEQNTSIKADMVKFSVRDKKMGDEFQTSLSELNKKLENLEKQGTPFSQNLSKRGQKYEGNSICFKVSQQVTLSPIDSRKGLKQAHMAHSSVVEYEEGSKLALQGRQYMTINEKTYFIDKDGYLLDKDNYYLLNNQNDQIKLSIKEIETLKKLKVLE